MVGALGYDPSRLQQSAAPVYKTEPHASADAVLLMRTEDGRQRTEKRSIFIRPPSSVVRPLKLARCMGIKPISTARQAVCLVRCIAARFVPSYGRQ